MQVSPFGRPNFAQTALVSTLTLIAVAVLGAVLAYWTWVWFAPRPEPRVEAAAALTGSVASAGTLFGSVPRNQAAAASTGIAVKLLGVVAAAGGRRGYAVVQVEGKQILALHEGEDLSPGVRLAEVLADHVLLERNGVRETLALPERKGTNAAPTKAAQYSTPQTREHAAQAAAAAAAVAPPGRGSRQRREGDD